MLEEFKRTRKGMLQKELSTIDTDNLKIMESIDKVEPKYAKHMFLRNELLKKFSLSVGGGIDLLDQPICTRCERPAAWNTGGSAYCFSCNTNIPPNNVITLMEYLMEHTKAFGEEELELLNKLGSELLNKLGGDNNEIIR